MPPVKTTRIPNRLFNKDWQKEYLFYENNEKATCLICGKSVSERKVDKLRRHYLANHPTYLTIRGNEREKLLKELQDKLAEKEENETSHIVKDPTSLAVEASFKVAENIAKAGKPFSEGEFIKLNLKDVARIVDPDFSSVVDKISLSRQTITRRIEDLSSNIKEQLKTRAKKFVNFSLALDECTDVSDVAQLAIFIRGVDEHLNVTEELLDLVPLRGTTTGADIFHAVEKAVDELELSWKNLVGIATDGAPSMTGLKQGFVGRLKMKLLNLGITHSVVIIHCIIHQEALCAKTFHVGNVMNVVIEHVNFIKKYALNHRQFVALLEGKDDEEMQLPRADFPDIPYFSAVRWLSKGRTLNVYFNLRHYVKAFMKEKGKDVSKLDDDLWVMDLAFTTDVFYYLNKLNIQLQGKDQLITTMYDRILAFVMKLDLLISELKSQNTQLFPCLKSLDAESLDKDHFKIYVEALKKLKEEFENRFGDFKRLKTKFDLFTRPFTVNLNDMPAEIKMELIDFKCNSELLDRFGRTTKEEFYSSIDKDRFPLIYENVLDILALFGSTYLCEQFFSIMNLQKSKFWSSMSLNHLSDTMRVAVSKSIQANIPNLVANVRCQISPQNSSITSSSSGISESSFSCDI